MATDAKPGFRLPWGADRGTGVPTPEGAPAPSTDDAPGEVAADPVTPGPASQESETPAMIDAAPATTDPEAAGDADGVSAAPEPPAQTPAGPPVAPLATTTPDAPDRGPRRPNKFMADLTKAMQAAAESARADALERLSADAKGVIESIHADSVSEATELRKRADDDVAAVRDWSKQEIARIREETDERITHRKERLEHEIEEHAAAIERRIERVQQRVTAFEDEMSAFFERLLGEDDPTRFAALAEALPEPPPLDAADGWTSAPIPTPSVTELPAVEPAPEPAAATAAEAPMQAAPEPSAADRTPEPAAVDADPRLTVLGLDQDFAAAEAEALAFTPDDGSVAEASVADEAPMPELGDDAIAARLAGIVTDAEAAPAPTQTRLVVVGLVSVASIAGFKRHLSRVAGVQHVGVTSGPDGEFVFGVDHDPAVGLRDVVATLPGFAARVTGESDGEIHVAATDPETEH